MALRWRRASRRVGRLAAAGLLAVVAVAWVVDPAMATGPVGWNKFLVSVNGVGVLGNGPSVAGTLSEDGQFLAFVSAATNLVPGDTNQHSDVFVKHLPTGAIHRVSVSSAGVQGNDSSIGRPSISADGRYVAFSSEATNLVPNDLNSHSDVFVRDRMTSTTVRVSVSTGGVEGNGYSDEPAISGNGQVVAFSAKASNLVPGDTNGRPDVFVRDWSATSPTTTTVSVTTGGTPGNGSSFDPSISRDGNLIAFTSFATDLVAGDTNGTSDILVRDIAGAATSLISTSHSGGASDGSSAEAEISIDGDWIVYESTATNLISRDTNNHRDVFQRRLAGTRSTLVSVARNPADQANGDSFEPTVSRNGSVAFTSKANNLALGNDTNGVADVFVRTNGMYVVSTAGNTTVGGSAPAISSDGNELVFTSASTIISPNDTNGASDLFMPSYKFLRCEVTGSGQLECAFAVTPEPNTVRWFIDGTYQPALDNLTIVGTQVTCQPGATGPVYAVFAGGGGIAGFRGSYRCPP